MPSKSLDIVSSKYHEKEYKTWHSHHCRPLPWICILHTITLLNKVCSPQHNMYLPTRIIIRRFGGHSGIELFSTPLFLSTRHQKPIGLVAEITYTIGRYRYLESKVGVRLSHKAWTLTHPPSKMSKMTLNNGPPMFPKLDSPACDSDDVGIQVKVCIPIEYNISSKIFSLQKSVTRFYLPLVDCSVSTNEWISSQHCSARINARVRENGSL